MQAKMMLNASAEEIYHTLIASVIGETKQACGKNITEKDLFEGVKYRHKVNVGKKVIDTTVHIRKPVENKNIHISVSYPDKVIEMDYDMQKDGDNKTLLTFTQTNSAEKKEPGYFEKIFFQRSIRSRFKKIEKYIIAQRKSQK